MQLLSAARRDQVTPGEISAMVERLRRPPASVIVPITAAAVTPASLAHDAMHVDASLPADSAIARSSSRVSASGAPPFYDETPSPELNAQQNVAFVRALRWLNADLAHRHDPLRHAAPAPLYQMIDGAAGTGKSRLMDTLVARVGGVAAGIIACAAPTGIAACNLPGGRTLHSLASLTLSGELSRTPAAVARALALLEKARVLVVDEVSLMEATLLVRLNSRLQAWFDSRLPFGGLAMMLMGDFYQMPPVGKSLLHAMFDADSEAGRLFRLFETLPFTQQMRAADDLLWCHILEYFRTPAVSMTPVRASGILSVLRLLTADDIAADALWLDAVIVTGANVTRFAINAAQIRRFALRRGLPVVAWRYRLEHKTEVAFRLAAQQTQTSFEDVCERYKTELMFYFVPGAPALLSGFNLCTEKQLTNNTRCTLHSLTLDIHNSTSTCDAVWARIHAAAPGELVIIDRPLSVNVCIARADCSSTAVWPSDETLVDDGGSSVVIPLMEQREARALKSVKVTSSAGSSSSSWQRAKADANLLYYHSYGVELAFAVTTHKVQGQTLARVLVDLSSCGRTQHTVSSLYVACSRVRRLEHLRVLPYSMSCRQRLESLEFDERLVRWWCSQQPDAASLASSIAAATRQLRLRDSKSAESSAVSSRLHAFSPALSSFGGGTNTSATSASNSALRVSAPAQSFGPQPMVLDNVAGDGNCFFRATAKQLSGGRADSSDAAHADIRATTFSFAVDNYETVMLEFCERNADNLLDFDEYLANLGVLRNYVDEFEIGLAARALGRPIVVVHADGHVVRYEYEGVTSGEDLLIFHHGGHFQSVRRE